ncbi:MAG: hypothetical protein ACLUIQ_07315 [Dialister invisus]
MEDPVRIIADGKLSVSMESRVFGGDSRVIVLTTSSAEPEKGEGSPVKGIEVILPTAIRRDVLIWKRP